MQAIVRIHLVGLIGCWLLVKSELLNLCISFNLQKWSCDVSELLNLCIPFTCKSGVVM